MLSNKIRMKLVNIICSILVERYGIKIPVAMKEKAAQIIVKIFPNLKDTMAEKGYVRVLSSISFHNVIRIF